MNYSKDIERSIDFIEENIKEKLTPQIVAQSVGYSQYHFGRVFQICMNLSVMEYIRQRRLSLAAVDLFSGKKIIDIAFDYCFETHSGFSKAFRRAYGYSPSQYAVRMAGISELVSKRNTTFEFGGYIMNPVIIKKPAFKVAGYGIRTNIEDGSYTKDIAAFWHDYDTEGWESKMYELLNPPKHGEVGICVPDSKHKGSLTYLLGVIVENFDNATDDMVTIEVPEAEYAVFTTPPIDTTSKIEDNQANFSKIIKQTWKYIFEEWFKNSGYEYDEGKLDFEFYDERCHFRPDTVMDIYVPIKKR
ncbi:AraC family transcriptional regulator [Wukongibacter baidiensis]|uniref:AraC family transcriptional regulator n=1 Tax=Wukongibacter baidiensis TaxID=1723361 RepID=UPI003D7FBB38